MLRLKPSIHSVPDNGWHTCMIVCVASFFIWQTGQNIIELFTAGGPINRLEQQLLEGEGHPLHLWLSSLDMEDVPLLWNRLFSFTGWVFTLGLVIGFLKKNTGIVGSLPAFILLFTLPGLSLFMCSAGSGSWGAYLFLKAFRTVAEKETSRELLQGGVYAGLAFLLAPIWFLPCLGLFIGSWELFRSRSKSVAFGFLAVAVPGSLLFLLLSQNGIGYLIAGPAQSYEMGTGWAMIIFRYLFLFAGLVLLLVYSVRRRGVGWWSLMFCLPYVLLEPFLASAHGTLLLPLWLLICLGLHKLTLILDIRFPRAYQSILLCQLLLWLPVYLGSQALYLYPAF